MVNEMLIGALTIIGGIVTKQIFGRQDRMETQISDLMQLASSVAVSLERLEKTTDVILEHILSKK